MCINHQDVKHVFHVAAFTKDRRYPSSLMSFNLYDKKQDNWNSGVLSAMLRVNVITKNSVDI